MTIDQTQQTIIREFTAYDDWFDVYERLIALGKAHPGLPPEFQTDAHAMPGCQSQVWVHADSHGGRVRFQADSDSLIIRGVLSLLLRVLDDRTPAELADARLYFLDEIGLTTNLSPARADGVAAIIHHMQQCTTPAESAAGVPRG